MSSKTTNPKSIRELEPLEKGGEVARVGFDFQDHIASRFLIEMLDDGEILEVWCEVFDDVTILRTNGTQITVEYVQVKSTQHNQLWTISKLCEAEKKADGSPGKSVFEKSLDYDLVCKEKPCFRLVTSRDISKILTPLKLPLFHNYRQASHKDFKKLLKKFETDRPHEKKLKSPMGRGYKFWFEHLLWDVTSQEREELKNKARLRAFCESKKQFFTQKILDNFYDDIVRKAKKAGDVKWKDYPDRKKIKREAFEDFIKERLEHYSNTQFIQGNLHRKMKEAKLPDSVISGAMELRVKYKKFTSVDRYSGSKLDELNSTMLMTLMQLYIEYDSPNNSETPAEFHNRCLKRLTEVLEKANISIEYSHLAAGCMYEIADRCRHHFVKGCGS